MRITELKRQQNMQKKGRQDFILSKIKENGRIYITELSNELNVSDDTLRRDLSDMDSLGLLTKVHGGAIDRIDLPLDFQSRKERDIEQKKTLAQKVIPLLKENNIIIIDGGTSNLEVVRLLPHGIRLTIYTNSFPVAAELMERPEIEVIFLGGTLFRASQVTLGMPVFQGLQAVIADWLILGVCTVDPKAGLTGPDREEALIKRLMIERADKVIVIADNHKIYKAENYVIGTPGDIDYLVVEDDSVEKLSESLNKYKCKVI